MTIDDIIELGCLLEDMVMMIDDLIQFKLLHLSNPYKEDYYIVNPYANDGIRITERLYKYLEKRIEKCASK